MRQGVQPSIHAGRSLNCEYAFSIFDSNSPTLRVAAVQAGHAAIHQDGRLGVTFFTELRTLGEAGAGIVIT